jgi:hypothetical protein
MRKPVFLIVLLMLFWPAFRGYRALGGEESRVKLVESRDAGSVHDSSFFWQRVTDELNSKKFRYSHDMWWQVRTTQDTARFRAIEGQLQKRLTPRGPSTTPGTLQVVTAMRSPSFKSTFFLIAYCFDQQFTNFPPVLGFVAADSIGDSLAYFVDCSDSSGVMDYEPDKAVDFLSRDWRLLPTTKAEAIRAATDIVSVVCTSYPLVFIDDVFQVFDLSNVLASDRIWELAEVDTSVANLLASFRITDLREHDVLTDKLIQPTYDSSYFTFYQDVVYPPRCTEDAEQGYRVNFFTYTPGHGTLVEWQVIIDRKGALNIEHFELISLLGFWVYYF